MQSLQGSSSSSSSVFQEKCSVHIVLTLWRHTYRMLLCVFLYTHCRIICRVYYYVKRVKWKIVAATLPQVVPKNIAKLAYEAFVDKRICVETFLFTHKYFLSCTIAQHTFRSSKGQNGWGPLDGCLGAKGLILPLQLQFPFFPFPTSAFFYVLFSLDCSCKN